MIKFRFFPVLAMFITKNIPSPFLHINTFLNIKIIVKCLNDTHLTGSLLVSLVTLGGKFSTDIDLFELFTFSS